VYLDVWTIKRRRRKVSAAGNQTATTQQQQPATMSPIVHKQPTTVSTTRKPTGVEHQANNPGHRVVKQSRQPEYSMQWQQ